MFDEPACRLSATKPSLVAPLVDRIALESKLDPKRFIRVHRSHILQIDAIREIEKYGQGYSVLIASGERVPISRGYVDRIKQMML
jgi:two-component system LytT family response regulator